MSVRTLFIRALLALIALAVLGTGGLLLLPSFLSAERYREFVVAQVKLATGYALEAKGPLEWSALPSLTLTLADIELATPGTPARAARMQVQFGWASLWQDLPVLSGITLEKPVFTLGSGGMEAHLALPPVPVQVQEGRITYRASETTPELVFDHIMLHMQRAGSGARAEGEGVLAGTALRMEAEWPEAVTAEAPARLSIHNQAGDQLNLSTYPLSGAGEWQGAFALTSPTAAAWLRAPQAADGAPADATPPPAPVVVESALFITPAAIRMEDLHVKQDPLAATGRATISRGDAPIVSVTLQGQSLALPTERLRELLRLVSGEVAEGETPPVWQSLTPAGTVLQVNLSAKQTQLGAYAFEQAALAGEFSAARTQITSFALNLPGGGTVALQGEVQRTTKGPRFQGTTQAKGQGLGPVLALFEPSAASLPPEVGGAFSLDANVFISAEQLRLSEAKLALSELQLAGGLVTYFEAQPRVEADIALSDTNLDYFRDSWRAAKAQGGAQPFMLRVAEGVDFGWLRRWQPVVDLKVTLNRFKFLDHPGSRASFRIYARQNEVGLYNIDMTYPEGTLSGSVGLNVASATPTLTLDVTAPFFDTAYFSAGGAAPARRLIDPSNPEHRWSNEVWELAWMNGIAANYKLATPVFAHAGERYEKARINGTLADGQLRFEHVEFERFGGKIEASGTLSGGNVPGLAASYTIYNADLAQVLAPLTEQNTLSGRISISGTVQTSGTSFEAWVQQALAKIVVAVRGMRVQRFNLQGVVDAVNASRSVADVVHNVERALPSGPTECALDGTLNVEAGAVRTPGLTLQSGKAVASVGGELRLMPWTLQLSTVFQMRMFPSETVPTFTVDLIGKPEAPELKTDTSSLEAYVAKRIVGQ